MPQRALPLREVAGLVAVYPGLSRLPGKTVVVRADAVEARSGRVALISGGECTVTVRGNGRGGRCAEFLVSLVDDLNGAEDIHALACDTDGIDGTEDNAGAIAAPDSLARAARLNLNAAKLLANNDGYSFFAALDDLVVTGPTRTNVNDYRAILIV